jgi:hypothetical protein
MRTGPDQLEQRIERVGASMLDVARDARDVPPVISAHMTSRWTRGSRERGLSGPRRRWLRWVAPWFVIGAAAAAVVGVSQRIEPADPIVGLFPVGLPVADVNSIEAYHYTNRPSRSHLVTIDGADAMINIAALDAQSDSGEVFGTTETVRVAGQEITKFCMDPDSSDPRQFSWSWKKSFGPERMLITVLTNSPSEQARRQLESIVAVINELPDGQATPTFRNGADVTSWTPPARSTSLFIQTATSFFASYSPHAPTAVERRVAALSAGVDTAAVVDGWIPQTPPSERSRAFRTIRRSEVTALRATLDTQMVNKISSPEWVDVGPDMSAARSVGYANFSLCVRIGPTGGNSKRASKPADATDDLRIDSRQIGCGPMNQFSRVLAGRWIVGGTGIGAMEARSNGRRLPVRTVKLNGITPYSVSMLEVPNGIDTVEIVSAPFDRAGKPYRFTATRPAW